MSHFSVLVCLPKGTDMDDIDAVVNDTLAPWNENTAVDPYRDYEEGAPEGHWWVSAVRRGAEHHRDGTGILPHYPDDPHGFKHPGQSSKDTEDQQRAEFADDAMWAEKLGERPDWATVVRLYNEKWHPGNEVALLDDDSDDELLHYDPESGRAFKWSTYNPESKWDWWVVGGRWQRRLIAMQGVDRSALIFGRPGSFGDNGAPTVTAAGGLYCDGGPRYLLDFEAMRREAEVEAHQRYDHWERISTDTAPVEPWANLCSLAELGEITWDEARSRYNTQPRVERARKEELTGFSGDPVEVEFLPDREEYVLRARRAAVPGYALVTLDREWVAPGRMGWFGMSSDGPGERTGYHIAVNTYLDAIDPHAYVVLVDCHI